MAWGLSIPKEIMRNTNKIFIFIFNLCQRFNVGQESAEWHASKGREGERKGEMYI